MPEQDTLYFELRDAMLAGGCPCCRLARRDSDTYLAGLIYEGVTDPDLREKVRDARGPCQRHAWRMAHTRGSVLGTAIIYRDIVNTLAKALDAGAASPIRWPGRGAGGKDAVARRLAATAECPACRFEADAVRRATKTLLKHLDQDEIAAAYATSGGLCLSHFQFILEHASEGAAQTLAAWQSAALRKLRDELDELIRKHDYRFAGEKITEAEADAWERAVAVVAGLG